MAPQISQTIPDEIHMEKKSASKGNYILVILKVV